MLKLTNNIKVSNKILIIVILILISLYVGFFFLFSFKPSNQSTQVIKNTITDQPVPKTEESSPASKILTPSAPIASSNQIKFPILFYHYIGNNPNPADRERDVLSITPDKFAEQMKYLHDNGYTSISLDTLYAALKKQTTLPNKAILLTFDDGYIDFYYNAYQILKQYNLSATVFIPTSLVGTPAYLTWDMIKEMHSSGIIIFGSHSNHHYYLSQISPEKVFQEVSESKKILSDQLGVPINFIAYPYGATNNIVISEVRKAGYVGGVGTWPSKMQSEGTIYNMPRYRISGPITLETFASYLQ